MRFFFLLFLFFLVGASELAQAAPCDVCEGAREEMMPREDLEALLADAVSRIDTYLSALTLRGLPPLRSGFLALRIAAAVAAAPRERAQQREVRRSGFLMLIFCARIGEGRTVTPRASRAAEPIG